MISRTQTKDEQILLRDPLFPDVEKAVATDFVTTADGVRLRFARWKPADVSAKGTILFLNGRGEYIEKSYETISDFISGGFEVLSFDWRGQGGSDRILENPKKGYVDEFDDYVIDLETIINDVALPDCKSPLFIVGHSMGALIALMAAPKIPNKIRRMVLCSPFIGIGGQKYSDTVIKIVSGALSAVGLGDAYLGSSKSPSETRPFGENLLTSDELRFDRNRKFSDENDHLSIGPPTANWVFAACKAQDQVKDPDFYPEITIPILFILAGSDAIVDNLETEHLAQYMRSGSTLTIDGARHELLQEADYFREQCLAALFSFIPGSDRD